MPGDYDHMKPYWALLYPVIIPKGKNPDEIILEILEQQYEFVDKLDCTGKYSRNIKVNDLLNFQRQEIITDFNDRCERNIKETKYLESIKLFKSQKNKNLSSSAQLLVEFEILELFLLPRLELLSNKDRIDLIQLIDSRNLPYKIAMLDFLGVLKKFDQKFETGVSKYKALARLLRPESFKNIEGRDIKGEIHSLTKVSNPRYKAHTYREVVLNDYNLLNRGICP